MPRPTCRGLGSPPSRAERTPTIFVGNDKPAEQIATGLPPPVSSSPSFLAVVCIRKNIKELTPASHRLTRTAFHSLRSGHNDSCMDKDDATAVLKFVANKVATRAAKRAAEEEAAAAERERKAMRVGEARAEWRAEIGARPAKVHRSVDNCLRFRSHVW